MRSVAALLLALGPMISGCYSVTGYAVNALHVGAPGEIDPGESHLAVSEIEGLSLERGPALHLRARLLDGTLVHVVGRAPPAGVLDLVQVARSPTRLHFELDPGPVPRGDVRLYVTEWRRRWSDGKQMARPAGMIATGDPVHVVESDGKIDPETTPLTDDMALHWAAAELHLRRSARFRKQRWNIVLTIPPPGGWSFPTNDLTDDTEDDAAPPTGVPLPQLVLGPSLASDASLGGPRPPAGSIPRTIAFIFLAPLTVVLDTISYICPLPFLFPEMLLAEEEGYQGYAYPDPAASSDDD